MCRSAIDRRVNGRSVRKSPAAIAASSRVSIAVRRKPVPDRPRRRDRLLLTATLSMDSSAPRRPVPRRRCRRLVLRSPCAPPCNLRRESAQRPGRHPQRAPYRRPGQRLPRGSPPAVGLHPSGRRAEPGTEIDTMRFLRPVTVAVLIAASAPLPLHGVPVSGQRTCAWAPACAEALLDAVVSGDRRELRPPFGIDAPRIARIPDVATMTAVRDAVVVARFHGRTAAWWKPRCRRALSGSAGRWQLALRGAADPDRGWPLGPGDARRPLGDRDAQAAAQRGGRDPHTPRRRRPRRGPAPVRITATCTACRPRRDRPLEAVRSTTASRAGCCADSG